MTHASDFTKRITVDGVVAAWQSVQASVTLRTSPLTKLWTFVQLRTNKLRKSFDFWKIVIRYPPHLGEDADYEGVGCLADAPPKDRRSPSGPLLGIVATSMPDTTGKLKPDPPPTA